MEYFRVTPSKYHRWLVVITGFITIAAVTAYDIYLWYKVAVVFSITAAIIFYLRQLTRQTIQMKFDPIEKRWWFQLKVDQRWHACSSIQHVNISERFLWLNILAIKSAPVNLLIDRDSMNPDILMQFRRCMLLSD